MSDVQFRRGEAGDALVLAAFAAKTFAATFAAGTDPADMAQFLAEKYSEALQRRELEDPDVSTVLGFASAQLVCFSQVRSGTAPDCVTDRSGLMELHRFYVDADYHGRGVAAQLMHEVLDRARARGARRLWLSVWEQNHRAIAFYRKMGFRDEGATVFVVGTDVQTDRVMTVEV